MIKEILCYAAGVATVVGLLQYKKEKDRAHQLEKLAQRQLPTSPPDKKSVIVTNPHGANLFTRINEHGKAIGKLGKLPYNSNAGTFTGIIRSGFVQVKVRIDFKVILLWLEGNKISIIKSSELPAYNMSTIPLPQEIKLRLLQIMNKQ